MNTDGRDFRNFNCAVLTIILFFGGCASESDMAMSELDGLAAADSYIVTQDGVSIESADIDPGRVRRDETGRAKKYSRTEKDFSDARDRLDDILKGGSRLKNGNYFDPNDVEAPDYDVPVYKSDVNKGLLLDELMSSAYEAYKKVTGDKWYPHRALSGVKKSRDPQLDPNWWQVYAGETLQNTLFKWGNRAGWRVVWKSDYEYPVEANAVFRGNFPKVVRKVLEVFEKEYPPIQAVFYKNRVVVIGNGERKG